MKIALIQQKYQDSIVQTLSNTKKMIKESVQNGAELVILQELHTTHYFAQSEDSANFDLADNFEYNKKFFSSIAKDNNIVLVTSLFEKRSSGIYHNTAVVFECDGSEVGQYRKMHIPDDPHFYEKYYFTPGDNEFLPIKTSVGSLGVMICWDQWFPEAARLMSLAGADILIYPTAIGWFDSDSKSEQSRQLSSWISVQRGHAVANSIPLVAVNRVGFEPYSSKYSNGIRFWGNSFVCDDTGEILAQGSKDSEQILYCNIDLKQKDKTRVQWPFFRDRRVDYYNNLNKISIDYISKK